MTPNPRFHMIARGELQQRLQDSACNIFSVMADIPLVECPEALDDPQPDWVTAMIGFEGTYSGLVALHCPEPLARRAAAGLLCMAGEVEQHDLFDAMGEVVNILGGDLKLFLDSGGRQVQLSTPSVFTGGREFHDEFFAHLATVTCNLAAGCDRLLVGVQVSRSA